MADPRDISSAKRGIAVTPHASNTFEACRSVYVGVSGDLEVVYADGGTPVVMENAGVGYHPISITAVRLGGTTASGIVALY